ncbi:MAG: InlB B-repeat-containing protein, partial [Lachnospiraceae bacterium]|nr:InlB B-repeat-containing protein [Lachnospiraceae bacterium]
MKRKLLGILLSVTMTFTALDFSAMASEQSGEVQTTVREDEKVHEESSASHESTATQEKTTEETLGNTASEDSENNIAFNINEIEEDESSISVGDNKADELNSETEETTALETESEEITEQQLQAEEITDSVEEDTKDAEETSTNSKLQVTYHTADEIKKFLEQSKAVKTERITYAEEPNLSVPYDVGALADTTLESAAAMVSQIRFIAGLPYKVTLNDEYSQLSQAAALVCYANGSLDQEPSQPEGMSKALYKQGCEGILKSNIAYTSMTSQSLNEIIVDSWMAGDNSDISRLTYRRGVLNPAMGQVGFGAVKDSKDVYSAMYVMDCSNDDENIFGVAWPAQNMPVDYFHENYPWSVSTGERLQASDIKVTLTRKSDGKEWNFSEALSDGDFYVDNGDYGQKGCIIFRPEASDMKAYADGDTFQVEITKNGKKYIDYRVNFFSLSEKEEQSESEESTQPGEEDVPLQYTVNFESNGGSDVPAQTIQENEKVVMPEEPIKDGYLFDGWYKETECENKWDFETDIVSVDIVLYAKWEEDIAETVYSEVDELSDAALDEEQTEGLTTESVAEDITTYIVTYDMQGYGEQLAPTMVDSGERLEEPDEPIAEGYEFAEWYQEAECINTWDFETDVVTKDTVLYAKWVQDNVLASSADTVQTTSETRIDLSAADTAAQVKSINSKTYNGSPYMPSVTVTVKNGKKRVTLKQDTDLYLIQILR